MSEESIVYLSLGSNIGDRCAHIKNALLEIGSSAGSILAASSIYENPPNGFEADQDFLNLCVKLSTTHSPINLLQRLKTIEIELGRKESLSAEYTSRCIDIDIIFFGGKLFNSDELIIPHTKFRERKFVLVPLNELSPQEIDPLTHLTIEQILANCSDNSTLHRYKCE